MMAAPTYVQQNGMTGAGTMAAPQYYGMQGNPLANFANMLGLGGGAFNTDIARFIRNPQAYFAGAGGSPASPNMAPVNSIINSLFGGNPNTQALPTAPAFQQTPSMMQMAQMQGTPLTLADTIAATGGLQQQVTDPALAMLNSGPMSNWLNQFSKANLSSLLGASGEAGQAPGGQASTFDATNLSRILPTLMGAYQWAANPYVAQEQNLAQANVGDAGNRANFASQFTNNNAYQAWQNAIAQLARNQQIAAQLAEQQLGYQNQSALLNQQYALNAANSGIGGLAGLAEQAAFTPEQFLNIGPSQGRGPSFMPPVNAAGSGGMQLDPNPFPNTGGGGNNSVTLSGMNPDGSYGTPISTMRQQQPSGGGGWDSTRGYA